ncbi:hypothetical protein ACFOGI_06825 [Virgibacillus xinjiangensis]|uniref:Uncharacterized protein n=1 Tax=Virgibacillus xinjiangensis TaxID=393090 RepID=A0ABV7CU84_9BACI
MYYCCHPYRYCPRYGYAYHPVRQLPPVDSELFYQSANEMKLLMEEVSLVLDRLAESKEFDTAVMHAAQASDQEEVQRLIESTGITSKVDVMFNPDNIRLEFTSKVGGEDCCHISIALRWR